MNLRREGFVVSVVLFISSVETYGQAIDELSEDRKTLQAAKLPTDGPGLLNIFRQFVPSETEQKRLETWVEQLGDESYRVREQATVALIRSGPMALAVLTHAQKNADLEQSSRAERAVQAIEATSWASITAAATRLVYEQRPAGASETLIDFLPYVTEPMLAEEIYEALGHLGLPNEHAHAVFTQALASPLAAQRAAAALVLGRHGTLEQRSLVRQMLGDTDSTVRLRAAQGLLSAGDRQAVDTLVALLLADHESARRAEDLLAQLAARDAPGILLGLDKESRQAAHAAWVVWWRNHRDSIDIAAAMADSDASPISRARGLSRRMLAAMVSGDINAIKQVIDVPFNVSDITLEKWSDVEQFFHQALDELRRNNGRIALRVTNVVSLDEYLRSAREAVRFSALPKQAVRVVYIRGQFGGPREETGALLVRISGQPRIIGLGPGEQIAEQGDR